MFVPLIFPFQLSLPIHLPAWVFFGNHSHVFSQSTSVMSLTYCPYMFSFHLFSISLVSFFSHSLASFASFPVTAPLSPTFLSNTSSEFLTHHLTLISPHWHKLRGLWVLFPLSFLIDIFLRYHFLGAAPIYCHHFPGHPVDFLEFILCPPDHSTTISQ